MEQNSKRIWLLVSIFVISAAIVFIEFQKPQKTNPNAVEIILPDYEQPVATTPSATSSATSSKEVATTSPTVTRPQAPVTQDRTLIRSKKADEYPRAKEFAEIQGYINTEEFRLSDLVGKKVILLDFWTYSCINCIRTTPYLNAWYQKYKDDGFVIVGIHTPEFNFEKNYDNVVNATKEMNIAYPVVLDNNYGTWNVYNNRYWPREYLIDIDGFIVHDKIGEGGYSSSERAIQNALKERNLALGINTKIDTSIVSPSDVISMDTSKVSSPEIYFGAARNEYLANGNARTLGTQTLTIPQTISANKLYLGGTWNFQNEYIESASAGTQILYKYGAKNVYFVASSENGVTIKVLRDGEPLVSEAGADVASDSTVFIKENKLYRLIEGADYGEHTIQIEVQGQGLDAYTFTFG